MTPHGVSAIGLVAVLSACGPDHPPPPSGSFTVVERVAVIDGMDVNLQGAEVSEEYFESMGVAPFLGRTFHAQDFQDDARAVMVISHELWEARFGGIPAVIGREIAVQGTPTTVLGVMPPGYEHAGKAQFWVPDRRK